MSHITIIFNQVWICIGSFRDVKFGYLFLAAVRRLRPLSDHEGGTDRGKWSAQSYLIMLHFIGDTCLIELVYCVLENVRE